MCVVMCVDFLGRQTVVHNSFLIIRYSLILRGGGVGAVHGGWGWVLSGREEGLLSTTGSDITPPSPVDRQTDRCKNITSPQTSFADGSNE